MNSQEIYTKSGDESRCNIEKTTSLKVSVIIPNYNHAKFLHQRIDSVLMQSYSNIEVIILDDLSSDNSIRIIDEFAKKDKRITTYYNKHNSGSPFRQWKKGIDNAKGEYIWIAESDDFADRFLLETLLHSFQINPNAKVAYCLSNFVNHKNDVVGSHLSNLSVLNPKLWKHDFCISGEEILRKYMIIMNIIPNMSSAIFKKELVKFVDWDDIFKYKLAGDRLFWIYLLSNTDLCYIAHPYNYFRIDGATVRSNYYNSIKYLNEVLTITHLVCTKFKVPLNIKLRALKQLAIRMRNAKKENPDLLKEFSTHDFIDDLNKIVRILIS
ncbi:MAG: glycosyltransferase family A protein [Melioribacteraceae bacterium]